VSYPDYREWRAARSFASIGAFAGAILTIGDNGLSPESVGGAYVSTEAFAILGESPILGRGFLADDDRAGAPPVVILGHRLWATRYGADPNMVGRSVTINAAPTTVVVIGLVGAFAVGRLLQGLLIQTSPTDPVTVVFIIVLLVVVSVAACFLPARKAANLDPLAVLRYE
jgi:hypothetical protein